MNEYGNQHSDADGEAVTRVRKGDEDAFEEIVLKYQKKMFNISYRLIGDYHEAAEVVQDAFLSAYRNIESFQGRSAFSTWLYAIVMNLSRNKLKQIRSRTCREAFSIDDPVNRGDKEMTIELPSQDLSVLDRIEKSELDREIQGCIKALDHEFSEVIVLRDIQGFSYSEICDILEVAEGTVKSRLHRARMSLKDCLKRIIGKG